MLLKSVALDVSNSGIVFKERQPLNIVLKLVPLDVSNRGIVFKE